MKWIAWVVRIVIVSGLILAPVGTVFAGTVSDVTLFATPLYGEGILSFTVTYVSSTRLDLSWTVGANVTNVMVRSMYGKYPNNITSTNETPSDGSLVYYGPLLSYSDTNVDFEVNYGMKLYYRAWAQRPDGTWFISARQDSKEGVVMTYIGFFLLAIGLTVISLRWINILWSLVASIMWLVLWRYNLTSPPGNIVIGSTTHEWLNYLFVGAAIVTMLMYFWNTRSRRTMQQRGYYTTENGNFVRNETPPPPGEQPWDADLQNYRARVRGALNQRRRP